MAQELYPEASNFPTNPRIEEFLNAAVPHPAESESEEFRSDDRGKAERFDQRLIARQAEAESRKRLGIDQPPEQTE